MNSLEMFFLIRCLMRWVSDVWLIVLLGSSGVVIGGMMLENDRVGVGEGIGVLFF